MNASRGAPREVIKNREREFAAQSSLRAMFEHGLTRVASVVGLVFVGACALASCATPSFSFGEPDAGATLPHCQDSQIDDGESDVDCGGTCAPCALSQRCNSQGDCKDGTCTGGSCQAAGCTDGVQSGTETDVDCGGGACKPCADGLGCASGSDCTSGVCGGSSCATATCNDRAKNGTESDVDCGGADCSACISGQGCLTPSDCVGGDCESGKCALACGAGTANCDGDAQNGCETNLRTDADHCGDCATPCSLPNASAACAGGVCAVGTCSAPFADCNGDPKDGCEANTKTDVENCGACGVSCPAIHGAPSCAGSACQISCDSGFADCDGKPENGCEKDVSHDVNNCGGCGVVCTPTQGGTPFCANDQCGERVCPSGWGDCNGDPTDDPTHDGCETNLRTDVNNCKTCGNLCVVANGVAACTDTQCTVASCNTGFADCTLGYANGCETNTQTDSANCGACGKACTVAGGTPLCAGGLCQVKSCTAPAADCDNSPTDGCEVNLSTNQTNCGGCGAAGSNCNSYFSNATAHCGNSACVFDGCGVDHANCDTDLTNGCEVDLKTDKNHCGNCGTACSTANTTSTSCNAGTCAPICAGTHISCTNPQNGCPIDSATDDGNCGGCGKGCDASAAAHVTSNHCSASACNPLCAPLFADCDSNKANGCELPVGSDKLNCGGCGVVCGSAHASATSCTGGACTPTCNAGFKNCGTPQQGCNTQLGTLSNCTDCGDACPANGFCLASGCSDHLDITVANSGLSAMMNFGTSGLPVLTKTHALSAGAGNSRIVLVGVTASEPYLTTESVKYNGTPMIAAAQINTSEMHSYAGIFYLLDAALPSTAGMYSVAVTYNNNDFGGFGAMNVVELENVQQTPSPFVTTSKTEVDNDCDQAGFGNRAVTLTFPQAQAGTIGYAVIGARTSTTATVSSPGTMTQTMNLRNASDPIFIGVAGYSLIGNTTTFSWDITDCWNSANVAVALKRVGN
jgi:hypothetical protein